MQMRSPPKYEHRPRSSKLGNTYSENAPGPTPQTRRCKSAVPASFHDKDWNKVPDPKRETVSVCNLYKWGEARCSESICNC